MKKLFVSLPMRDRTEEDIRCEQEMLRDIVEKEFDEEFELIETFEAGVEPPSDVKNGCWYLGQSICKLALADLVIFSDSWKAAPGCLIEHMVCALYDIPYVDMSIPTDGFEPSQIDLVVDYTHDLDEQPVEFVDKPDILHDGFDEHLEDPDLSNGSDTDIFDDYDPEDDELEPGEYDADAE